MEVCRTVLYQHGATAQEVYFLIVCTNVPVDTPVWFEAKQPGPNPAIKLPPVLVTSSQRFTAGIVSMVPAGYVSEIVYCYDFRDKTPYPPGFDVTFQTLAFSDVQTVLTEL